MVLGADSSREIQFFKKEDVYVRWSLREQENKKREPVQPYPWKRTSRQQAEKA